MDNIMKQIEYLKIEIINEDEISSYDRVSKSETVIPINILENALIILKALGCTNIYLISYYSLSDKGWLFVSNDRKQGIRIKD